MIKNVSQLEQAYIEVCAIRWQLNKYRISVHDAIDRGGKIGRGLAQIYQTMSQDQRYKIKFIKRKKNFDIYACEL